MPRYKIRAKQLLALELGMPFNSSAKDVAKKVVEVSDKKLLVDDSILLSKPLCLEFIKSIVLKKMHGISK